MPKKIIKNTLGCHPSQLIVTNWASSAPPHGDFTPPPTWPAPWMLTNQVIESGDDNVVVKEVQLELSLKFEVVNSFSAFPNSKPTKKYLKSTKFDEDLHNCFLNLMCAYLQFPSSLFNSAANQAKTKHPIKSSMAVDIMGHHPTATGLFWDFCRGATTASWQRCGKSERIKSREFLCGKMRTWEKTSEEIGNEFLMVSVCHVYCFFQLTIGQIHWEMAENRRCHTATKKKWIGLLP